MKFSIRFADQIVGALIILALVILIVVIFMLGSSQRWFVTDLEYKTYFSSASGLSPNMAVQFKGFTIGHVKKITLEYDRVEVAFSIFEEHADRIRIGSLVELSVSPIGLGSTFSFIPGLGIDLIPEGMTIPDINSEEGRAYLDAGWNERTEPSDGISNIMNQVNTLLDTINVSLSGSSGASELELGKIIQNVQSTTENISSLTGNLWSEINPVIGNIDSLMGDISVIIGEVAKIMGDVQIVTNRISDPSEAVMDILSREGPIYHSLTELISSIAGIISNLERTSNFIPAQLPQIGVLISQLNVTMNMVQDVLAAVANNPLLSGGVPTRNEISPVGANPRDMEF